MPALESPFALPERLAAKRAADLIAADERHFERIAAMLERTAADLTARLSAGRAQVAEEGGERVERDAEIRRLTARLRVLERYGLDLALGRMLPADGGDAVYVGRLGLTDADGTRLLVDWRSPAAEPFFGATHAEPMGLASRRRYRWTRGRITDYWDEAFTADALEHTAALDDQSVFIASLGTSRSPRMRDVLGTIQADQDAIIRAGSRGALVVDGGPGTGKTVVALHRAAYLVFADPRLSRRHGGVLFVGPSPAYLAYVADVLPNLGEDGVRLCTVADLVPEGASAPPEPDARIAALKASPALAAAVERAVRLYELPPKDGARVETDWTDLMLSAEDWADAFDAAEPGAPHNEARDQVWDELVEVLVRRLDGEVPAAQVRRSALGNADLRRAFQRAWPVLDPVGVVADLLSVPGYLRRCAPGLAEDDLRLLMRTEPRAWTTADLPLLDLARHLIGDPEASRRRREREAAIATERERIKRVADDLIAAGAGGEGELGGIWMLSQDDVRDQLLDEGALPSLDPDVLAGPFAHVVVDEAQELTDAEWAMLLRRCPSRSFTVVGDRAQARAGFAESWAARLERIGLGDATIASLTVNYRTPAEVMAEAEPVIRAALPDANVPTSVRSSGLPVVHARVGELDAILQQWMSEHDDGIACVLGDPAFAPGERVRSLTPQTAKGLEFDLVVLVEPDRWSPVDRYVAMTRATQQLVVLEG